MGTLAVNAPADALEIHANEPVEVLLVSFEHTRMTGDEDGDFHRH